MKQRNIILSLVVGLLIISGIFFSGIFSIIGVGEIGNEVCVFNETNKECTIQVEVPENRALSLYTFDMDFEAVPEAEFKGLTSVNAFVNGGSYTEEDDKDLTSSLEAREYNYLWLYRLPATWGTPYEIKTIARVSEASAVVTQDSATSEVELYTGVFFEDYPYSTIEVCNEYYTRDCPNPYYLVQIYDNSRNEQQVRLSSDVRATSINSINNDVYSSNIDEPEVAPLYWEGSNFVNTYVYPYENMAVYVHIQVADEEQGYATQTWTPPTLEMSYRESIFPSNVEYGINNRVFDTLEGENEAGVVTSLEISDQINDYCGRNDNASGACVFELTITSDTIGKVIVSNENLILSFADGDTSCAKKGGCFVEPVEEPVVEEPSFIQKYVNFDVSKDGRDINTLTTYLVIVMIMSAVILYVRRK